MNLGSSGRSHIPDQIINRWNVNLNALDSNLGEARKRLLELESGHSGDNVYSPGGDSNLEDRIVLLEVVSGEALQQSPKSPQRFQCGLRIVR